MNINPVLAFKGGRISKLFKDPTRETLCWKQGEWNLLEIRQTKLQVVARNLRLKSDCVGVGSSKETNNDFQIDRMSSDQCSPNFNPWYGIAPFLAMLRMPTCGWPRTPMLDFGNVEILRPNVPGGAAKKTNPQFIECHETRVSFLSSSCFHTQGLRFAGFVIGP